MLKVLQQLLPCPLLHVAAALSFAQRDFEPLAGHVLLLVSAHEVLKASGVKGLHAVPQPILPETA
jgi:hypothetical protein